MFSPKWQIILTPKSFPQDDFICLGRQLISIINVVKDFLPEHVWYGADVNATGKGAMEGNVNNFQPNLIGFDLDFIQYCSKIEQFIWGVFLCVDNSCLSKNIEAVELETEDQPFRPIACNGILLEIRTFDTSYFEIYSENREMAETIKKQFEYAELTCKD